MKMFVLFWLVGLFLSLLMWVGIIYITAHFLGKFW